MNLRIYLDDCAFAKPLVQLLRNAGHDVLTPHEAATAGFADNLHLQRAIAEDRALITKDPDDFAVLHQSNSQHSGILAIHQDNDPTRDMSYADIVRAVQNLIQAGVPIRGQYWVLNAWKY